MTHVEHKLIGIAGPTSTGKTTLDSQLARLMQPPPTILSFDEYDRFPSGSEAMDRELVEKNIVNWEDPALFDEEAYINDLERIKKGLPVVLQTRSRESIERGEIKRTMRPTDITIVEGVFLYHDPRARKQFDLRFYIDIPIQEMIKRRLARTPLESTDPWDQREYIEGEMVRGTELFVSPQRQHAHVVLNGLLPTEELAHAVIFQMNHHGIR